MKAPAVALIGAATLPRSARGNCLDGDMMLLEGDSGGHVGYECVDSTSFDGVESVCGPDGEMVEVEKQLSCGETTPYCVQCGPRCYGGALCLSSPDVGNRPCPTTCWEDDRNTDDEDFLPEFPSTPAAVNDVMFDMCESEADVAVWTEDGGESTRAERMAFCAMDYDGGSGCKLETSCIEECYQNLYGYSAVCSKCFGAFATCSLERGCATGVCRDVMWTPGRGLREQRTSPECEECNAPCVDQLNECTGLPEVPAPVPVPNVPIPSPTPPPTASPTPVPTPVPSPEPVSTPGVPLPATPAPSPSSVLGPDVPLVVTPVPSPDPTEPPTKASAKTSSPTSSPTTPPVPGQTPRPTVTPRPTNKPTTAAPTSDETGSPTGLGLNLDPVRPPTTPKPTDAPSASPTATLPGPDPSRGGGGGGSAAHATKSITAVVIAAIGALAVVFA